MREQIQYFLKDYKRVCGNKSGRFLYMWFSRIGVGILTYRFERGLYLTLGTAWSVLRVIISPLLNLCYSYSNLEINYKANIGPGLLVLHAAPGIVVSGKSVIGKNLTLTGGNIIGYRKGHDHSNFIIGDNCSVGANAVILGPIVLGNNLKIGACALVIHGCGDNEILIGNPAKSSPKTNS